MDQRLPVDCRSNSGSAGHLNSSGTDGDDPSEMDAMAAMNPLLKTQNLSKHFGGLQAVEGVNLDLNEGEIRAIIGPN